MVETYTSVPVRTVDYEVMAVVDSSNSHSNQDSSLEDNLNKKKYNISEYNIKYDNYYRLSIGVGLCDRRLHTGVLNPVFPELHGVTFFVIFLNFMMEKTVTLIIAFINFFPTIR